MEIDARGLSCPQPVIETKKVLDTHPDGVSVLVDNRAALENVSRYAGAARYSVAVSETEDGWKLDLKKE